MVKMQFTKMFSSPAKKRVDNLFLTHAIMAIVSGLLAFIFPHAFEWFMVHHGEKLAFRDNIGSDEQKVTHLVTRLYGALIISQVSTRPG
jgi:alkylation response protein AidB-like acyl-CoA dehydrogenase